MFIFCSRDEGEEKKWVLLCEHRWRGCWGENVCNSEGPSLLCSRDRSEGGGLWGRLAAAVLSIQALPAHWTRVMLSGKERRALKTPLGIAFLRRRHTGLPDSRL